ncbi:hypothetical protein [Labedaea rhizosphaerae]|uniref:Lipocalin-like protein n=1 Tax=Labedaea rhizosphaerae TaxID=598644 RepID=A0A4R6S4N0_LABRH|nr:hypothetical protein [Labedaea rhizosphaerae]TDP93685.1 hypothetical protein EV186_10679 [Labedaea rhizosphaerae]
MRSSMAVAGSAAVLLALLVSGCGSDTTGSAHPQTTTTATTTGSSVPGVPGVGGGETSLPAIDTKTLEQPDPLESLAGDWRQDTTSKPIMAHVAKDGGITLAQDGRTAKGQFVWLGDKHFRILLISTQGTAPAHITADLSADGNTMTVHSSAEPGPIVYKRVG